MALPRVAAADADFQLRVIDGPDEGFNDPTPVTPVGGNSGTTLGEQRRIAVTYALGLWGAVLDSSVPIVVEANFSELGCDGDGSAVLASAAPTTAIDNVGSLWASRDLVYPSALGDRLLGRDAAPGDPDIEANFNSSIDLPSCNVGVRWYYGLDAAQGAGVDLVQTTLHELAHGLGMTLLLDAQSGAFLLDKPDPFAALALDHTVERHLPEMTAAERIAALSHGLQVAFDGPRTRQAATSLLAGPSPQLLTSTPVAGFSGMAADTDFAEIPTAPGVTGPLVEASPNDGCSPVQNAAGNVVVLRPVCFPDQAALAAAQRGALGVILALSEYWTSPPSPLDLDQNARSPIPVFVVTEGDANALLAAAGLAPLEVTLRAHPSRRAGTDDEGRPLLNATNPVTTSMLTHWDMSARPNLLMEPYVRPMEDLHGLDLTLPVLEDVGYRDPCGNGVLEAGEACDDGASNGSPGACNADCSAIDCGDNCAPASGGTVPSTPDASVDPCADGACDAPLTSSSSDGCGCRVHRTGRTHVGATSFMVLLGGALGARVRRRKKRRSQHPNQLD